MKKLVAGALVASLALSLGGCGAPPEPGPGFDTEAIDAQRRADDQRPPAERVSTESLLGTLGMLPKDRAVRGSIESQKGLIETERVLVRELKKIGYEPMLQNLVWNLKYQQDAQASGKPANVAYSTGGPLNPETTPELAANVWHNIIVEIPGTVHPEEVLIVGAHFDAVAGSPGADDNGSGTAALLEIAKALKDRPMERTVRLVFFNLEEIGVRGAQEYAKSIRDELNDGTRKLIGMMSLEMLGYFTSEPGSQRSPIPKIEGVFDPPTVGDFIGMATIKPFSEFARALEKGMNAAAPELKVVVVDFPPVAPPDFLRSDHAPFLLMGHPAVMITDTSNYRNPNYHKPTDTIETLDAERYTLVVRALAGAVYEVAGPVRSGAAVR
jgi:aminopeptidase YwaD